MQLRYNFLTRGLSAPLRSLVSPHIAKIPCLLFFYVFSLYRSYLSCTPQPCISRATQVEARKPLPAPFVFEERNPADFKIFIGNLSWEATKDDVRKLCTAHGNVWDVRIANHKETGCGRGFGHVEFETMEQAQTAAKAMDGVEFFDRSAVT